MSRSRQRGLSMLLVIFLLGVLGVMGTVIASLSGVQHFTTALSARAAQGYFAARAGMDYAVARIAAGAGCAGVSPNLALEGYDLALSCAVSGTFDEGAATPYSVYDLAVTASRGGFSAPDATNRRLRATVKFP